MTARKIPEELSARVRVAAENRCEYCLTHQRYAMQVLETEHIIPRARGGTDDEDNLWLAACVIMPKAHKRMDMTH